VAMPHYPTSTALFGLAAIAIAATLPRLSAADYYVYYGTAEGGAGKGISMGHFDSDTGVLTKPVLAAEADGPSFFTLSSNGKFLYSGYENANKVAAYAIDPATGALKLLNVVDSGGSGPCHLSLDPTGHFVLVANYNSGSVAIRAIKPDGSLGDQTGADQQAGTGPDKDRQEGPHAHCIITDPSDKFALSADLGNDKIYIYQFDAIAGKIAPNTPAFGQVSPGQGPRHLIFSPNGKVLYCITEMGSTVSAFNWDGAKGSLTKFQDITTLPADFKAFNKDAEIKFSPNGKYLYASARGHDAIAVFAVDASTGKLSLVQDVSAGGQYPRYFSFDPTGKWVICGHQNSNTVAVFSYDATTGKLTQHGDPIAATSPICLGFLPVK